MSSYKHAFSVWFKLIWISVNDYIAMCILIAILCKLASHSSGLEAEERQWPILKAYMLVH